MIVVNNYLTVILEGDLIRGLTVDCAHAIIICFSWQLTRPFRADDVYAGEAAGRRTELHRLSGCTIRS